MPGPYMLGAIPSPRHLAFAAIPHRITGPYPPSFLVVPKKLDIWGNDTYGDCVSAEEAAAKAMYSVLYGAGAELFIDPATLIAWARKHGVLNGATLTGVMDAMASDGITFNGVTYKDGPYQSVDWTNDAVLSSAIFTGPVKIAVKAAQLESVHTDSNGWYADGFHGKLMPSDHCVNLCGYGTVAELYGLMGVPAPSKANLTARAYAMFTWGSEGVITATSLNAICDEAWLRTPTTVGQNPTPAPIPGPTPGPGPQPTPSPTPSPGGPWAFTLPDGGVISLYYTPPNPLPPAG